MLIKSTSCKHTFMVIAVITRYNSLYLSANITTALVFLFKSNLAGDYCCQNLN